MNKKRIQKNVSLVLMTQDVVTPHVLRTQDWCYSPMLRTPGVHISQVSLVTSGLFASAISCLPSV